MHKVTCTSIPCQLVMMPAIILSVLMFKVFQSFIDPGGGFNKILMKWPNLYLKSLFCTSLKQGHIWSVEAATFSLVPPVIETL